MLNYKIEKEHTGGGCWMHWLTFDSGRTIGVSNLDDVIVLPPKGVNYDDSRWEAEWYEKSGQDYVVYNWKTENINDYLTDYDCTEEEILEVSNYCFKSEIDPAFRWAW